MDLIQKILKIIKKNPPKTVGFLFNIYSMKLRRYHQFINESVEVTDDVINLLVERSNFWNEIMELDYSRFDFTYSYSDMCKRRGRNPEADFQRIQKYFDGKGFTLEKLKNLFSEESNKKCGYDISNFFEGRNTDSFKNIFLSLEKSRDIDKINKIKYEISELKNEIKIQKNEIEWLFSDEPDAKLQLTSMQLKSTGPNFRQNKKREMESEVKELENRLEELSHELEMARLVDIADDPFSGQSLDETGAIQDIYFYFLFEKLEVTDKVWLGGYGWSEIDGLGDNDYSEAFIRYRYGYHQTEYGKLWMKQCRIDEEWLKEEAMDSLHKYLEEEFTSILRNSTKRNKDIGSLNIDDYSIIEEDRIIINLQKIVDFINKAPYSTYASDRDYTVDIEKIAAQFTKELEGFALDIELSYTDELIIWGRFKEN